MVVNTFPELVLTARHILRGDLTRNHFLQPFWEKDDYSRIAERNKVVTR